MEYFFYEDRFCRDLYELMSELDIEEENISSLPDDWSVECQHTQIQKLAYLDVAELRDYIMDSNQDRWPEDTAHMEHELEKAIMDSVDFKKLNELMPTAHYMNGDSFTVTKSDLIAWCE